MTDFMFQSSEPNRYLFDPTHKEIEELIEDLKARAIDRYSFCLPRGWYEIVAAAHRDLIKINPNYRLAQIKEKFGGLRFYTDLPLDIAEEEANAFRDRIRRVENLSWEVCQQTGRPGSLYKNGYWYATLSPFVVKTNPGWAAATRVDLGGGVWGTT